MNIYVQSESNKCDRLERHRLKNIGGYAIITCLAIYKTITFCCRNFQNRQPHQTLKFQCISKQATEFY